MQTTGSHIINYNLRLPRSGERDRSIYQISDLLRQDFDRIPEIDRYEVTPGGNQGLRGAVRPTFRSKSTDMI